MKAPIIGYIPAWNDEMQQYTVSENYIHAVIQSGGIPLALPMTDKEEALAEAASHCSGFLFLGGGDLHPRLYGEETLSLCGKIQPQRDFAELALFRIIYPLQKPILGICRGCQLINVALGGSLWQDIPSQCSSASLQHRQLSGNAVEVHSVSVEKESLLFSAVKAENLWVNSMHHQAIKRAGQGLSVSARSSDGIIEAVECPAHHFLLGIQWHPERLFATQQQARQIFEAWIKAC